MSSSSPFSSSATLVSCAAADVGVLITFMMGICFDTNDERLELVGAVVVVGTDVFVVVVVVVATTGGVDESGCDNAGTMVGF